MRALIFFLTGMIITLIIANSFSYCFMYSAVEKIDSESMQSDLAQISIGVDGLHARVSQLAKQIYSAEYFITLLENDRKIDTALVESVNEFSESIRSIINYLPYIHSVYLFLPDEQIYCFSKTNTRFLFNEWDPKASDNVQNNVLTYKGKNIQYIAGFLTDDYPVKSVTAEEVDLVSAVCFIKDTWLVINLYASEFKSCYSGIAFDDNCIIYLVTLDGMIVSTLNEEETGKQYTYFSQISSSDSGSVQHDERKILSSNTEQSPFIVVIEILGSKFMKKFIVQEQIMLIVILLGLVCTCFLFDVWMKKALYPMNHFTRSMELVGKGKYESLIPEQGTAEISSLICCYNKMLTNLQILTHKKELIEQEKINIELTALRKQINPHFLYNTLNTIKWMALADGNQKISDNITALAKYIAPMFQGKGSFCTLRDELYLVELYCQIMNARFDGGVSLNYNIDKDTELVQVPRLILQPVIENCFLHGFNKYNKEGVILVETRKTGLDIEIRIEDNGTGIEESNLQQINKILESGELTDEIGLTNTNRRLRLRYGDTYGICLNHSRSGTGLSVIYLIPYEYKYL